MSIPPIIGFAAYSGTGKTTLLEKLLPLISARGFTIGLIKASHHSIELDKPGKDSYRLRKAGASQLLLSTPERSICFTEHKKPTEPSLEEQLQLLDLKQLDFVLVEGFRNAAIPKIELYRQELNKPFLFENDNNVVAIATDHPIKHTPDRLIQLSINDPEQIAAFIFTHFLNQ